MKLNLLAVSLLFVLAGSLNLQAQLCLEASYPFNGNANDATGNGYNGTINGATLTTDRFGNPNSAYEFDGTNDWINTNSTFDYTNRTVSVWFTAESLDGSGINGRAVLNMDGNLTNGVCLVHIDDYQIRSRGGGNPSNFFSDSIRANTWHHFVAVREPATTYYYLDGNPIGSSASGNVNSASTPYGFMTIGTDRTRSRAWFDGKIDDIKIFDCALDSAEVRNLYDDESMPPPAGPCLVAAYPFDGDASDTTGNGNNGTVNGATPTIDRFGNANSAYYFDGVDDYINTNSAFDYSDRTVSVWFTAHDLSGSGINGNAIFNMDGFMNNGLCLAAVDDYRIRSKGGGNTNNFYSDSILRNTWYHFSAVRDGNTTYYYLNGQQIGSDASGTANSASTPYGLFVIGTDRTRSRGFFEGKIDDIKIWNCVLDSMEIRQLFEDEEGPTLPSNGCLRAAYPFDGNAVDSTGNGFDGTVFGATSTVDRFGNANSAYNFDGSNDYISTNSVFDYEERTVSVWFAADELTGSGTGGNSILNMDGFLANGLCLAAIDDYQIRSKGGGNISNFYSDSIMAKEWYQLVMVRESDSTKYYLNGMMIGGQLSDNANSLTTPHGFMVVGTDRTRSRGFFDGLIDDLKVWECAFTSEQVTNLYNEEKVPETSIGPDLADEGFFSIYPNPSSGAFTIELGEAYRNSQAKLSVFNSIGQIVETVETSGSEKLISINLENENGTYFVKMETSTSIQIEQVIIF